ncbi:MAG: class F sortase [Chloroflexota bacterium]|nr:class F sortase [Chloroflexota bacterium]
MPTPLPTPLARRPRRPRFPLDLAPLVLLVAALLVAPAAVRAQEDEEDGAGTPAPIVSTRTGEVPSFGGRRPGPLDEPAAEEDRPSGVAPVAIEIERAAVSAEIEALDIVDGAMADPTGPWVVAWYEDLAGLGETGNVVMAGHIDYWNVGPAVFYSINQLAEGDEIGVTGTDGEVYAYAVEWVRQYDAADAPLDEITGRTTDEALTLITCGGTFDYATGEYLQRTVVRASRLAEGTA